MSQVPNNVFRKIRERVWGIADQAGWITLPATQKSLLYEEWVHDAQAGGVLANYMDPVNVRVYLKDTIMKPYGRERTQDFAPICKLLSLDPAHGVVQRYVKPHGRLLADGRVVCWGLNRDWKGVLLAVFERASVAPDGVPFAAVLLGATVNLQPEYRMVIEEAGARLGIVNLVFSDSLL